MFKNLIHKIKEFIKKNPKLSVLLLIALFAFYVFLTIESLHFSSVPGFCEKCHPEKKTGPLSEVHTWRQNIHAKAGVECLDCHGEPGFIGYMKAKMGGLKDVYSEFLKSPEHKMAILIKGSSDPKHAAQLVPNEICLFCHSDEYNQKIRKQTVMSVGVKFRKLDDIKNPAFRKSLGMPDILTDKPRTEIDPHHKKHIDKGVNCVDCHLGVVHGGDFRNKVDMKWCTECHQKRASEISMSEIQIGTDDNPIRFSHKNHIAIFKCDDCHNNLFRMKKGSTKITYADHTLDKACYACHNGKKSFGVENCTACHTKTPAPKETLHYKIKGVAPAHFSHDFHGKMFTCKDCHDKYFVMKKGGNKMTMKGMYEGKYCGACHNGNFGFSVNECAKCHYDKK